MEVRDGVLQTTPSVEAELEWQSDHWVLYNFYYNDPELHDSKSNGLRGLFMQWDEYHRKQNTTQ